MSIERRKLSNRGEIMKFLGIGKRRFYRYLNTTPPMPARNDGWCWEAYTDELDAWKREYIKFGQ